VIAWTSFVADPRTSKVYSVANGGHADYAGNEVDELQLETEQPGWRQILAPTPNGSLTNCQSYYGDGRPAARHSYYGVTLDPFRDRIMLFGGVFWCAAGGFHSAISSYNIGSNTYNPAGTHPNMSGGFLESAYAVDPATGDVYGAFNFVYRRWNQSSNTITVLNPNGGQPAGNSAAAATDTRRGRFLMVGGDTSNHHYYTFTSNTFTSITLNGPNAANVTSADAAALVYVDVLDRFLFRRSAAGGTVYQIDPVTFAVTTYPTTGGSGVPSTQNGPYNKFLYVPRLGGIVYVPSYNGNAWFLRVR
jgi:hypothetical protein